MIEKQQQCATCNYVAKCYSNRTSPRNIVMNILACRIRLGINRNDSSKLLLQMIRPNLLRLIGNAKAKVGSGYIDTQTLLMDLESRVIECLISENGYKIGETAFLTEYLFGSNPRTGWVRKWILWNFSKHQRFYKKHMLYGQDPRSDTEEEIPEADRSALFEHEAFISIDSDDNNNDAIAAIMRIIDDGVTLNANEYRVIAFCLSNANESNKSRLIDGTHTYLSQIMMVSRPRITRLYSVAKQKLLRKSRTCGIMMGND